MDRHNRTISNRNFLFVQMKDKQEHERSGEKLKMAELHMENSMKEMAIDRPKAIEKSKRQKEVISAVRRRRHDR